jgi:DNA topoisomerase-1
MVQRRSRFGKPFFSCSNYPDCDVIVNHLEDLEEKYPDHPKTPYVKKQKWGKKGAKTAAAKTPKKKTAAKKTARKQAALTLSPELQAITGEAELSRPEVVKKVWEYIKAHDCQDPKNKRMIVPDAKLAKVIGKSPIDMMKLAGHLGKHLS